MFQSSSTIPEKFQQELSHLIRDLNLCKEAVEFLSSRLKDKNCPGTGASITIYCKRKQNYFCIFAKKKNLFTAKTSRDFC